MSGQISRKHRSSCTETCKVFFGRAVTIKRTDNGSVERFVLSKDRRKIYRVVSTRRRKKIRTSFKLDKALKKASDSNERLASCTDQGFIRSKRRPRPKQRGRIVRVADLFSGCGAMSVGVEEACRALGLCFKPVL